MNNIDILKIGCGRFVYGYGAISLVPQEIKRYGLNAYIIGGKTTLKLILDKIESDLREEGIRFETLTLNEPNSVELAQEIAVNMQQNKSQVIVAVGGGRCMDVCKVSSDMAKVPLITIPTSIATCASCSAVSILYTKDKGCYDCSLPKENEIDSVIVDLNIIAQSPKRLIAAGIMDSIAKLPELVNGPKKLMYPDISLKKYIAYYNSLFIYDFLTKYGIEVYENPQCNTNLLKDLSLINLLITSMISGFSSGTDQLAIAHGLYNGIKTYFPIESKNALHGEIVGVGVLLQLDFNGVPQDEYQRIFRLMKQMNMPLKLESVGVKSSEENVAKLINYIITTNKLTTCKDIRQLKKSFNRIV